jgi:hypothetical protein
MDTSGTGHDRCPSEVPDPFKASGAPPRGGSGKIKKSIFGFKGAVNFFCSLPPIGLNERLSAKGGRKFQVRVSGAFYAGADYARPPQPARSFLEMTPDAAQNFHRLDRC